MTNTTAPTSKTNTGGILGSIGTAQLEVSTDKKTIVNITLAGFGIVIFAVLFNKFIDKIF